MRARRSTLTIGILAALISQIGHTENPAVQAQLVEQGQYWQARDNNQRAAEVWQKVLLLDQGQVNALYGMGLIGVKQNKPQQANEYLARMQALSPVPWQARQLMQDMALAKPENQALLNDARRFVDAGDRDKATETFRRLFKDLTPQGTIGREYYNNLAFNDGGWPEARKGFERLLQETPDDSILALFYAKQLARHDQSRAEGIRLLARLSKRTDIAGDADESWRLALVWMGPPTAAQVPLFEEFLKVHPDDQEIRSQMQKGRQQAGAGQQNPLVRRGLQAMDQGDLAGAEKLFQERLASVPDDRDALGGMGVIRQQQDRLPEAEQFLTRAVGKGGSSWKVALDSVRYWSLINQGRDLQARGQTAQAQDVFARAVRLNPQSIDGRVAIANVQAGAEQFDTAIAGYRQILKMQPGNLPATEGLINVLAQTGKADEALRMLDSLSPADQAKLGGQGRLYAMRASRQATLAQQRGDIAGAQAALREAIKHDPDNVWLAFDFARLYLAAGEPKRARGVLDAFIAAHRDNVEALYASALLSVEMEQWEDAQTTLSRIPVNRRTPAMNSLAKQITLTTQMNQAVSLSKSGQQQQALILLDRLQPMVVDNPDYIGMLASAYVDAGDSQRALSMMEPLVVQNTSPSHNQLLQYASILLRTGDDAMVYGILVQLQGQQLSAATRKRYDDLQHLYRVRQADQLREGGDLVLAYDTLVPALMQRPGDIGATSALARMFTAAGNNVKALELYKPLVQRNPEDTRLLLNTADVAVLAQDKAYADNLLGQFVKLQSNDPTLLTEAARIYRSLGKSSEATALLRKAVALENSEKQRSLSSQFAGVDLAVNPFLNQRRQRGADVASAIPPPAETLLYRGAVAAANTRLPVPADTMRRTPVAVPVPAPAYAQAPASGATSYAPAYAVRSNVVNQPANNPSVVSVAQRDAFLQQLAPQTAMPVADNSSPARRALDEILQSRSAYVTQGVVVRGNFSEGGLSQMDDVQAPLEVNIPAGDNRFAVRVTPVSLNSGSMTDEAASRFGSGGNSAAGVGTQRANGVGIGAAYERPDAGIKADIGTTPLGFKYKNVVGGASIEQAMEGSTNGRYAVALSRRAVTDSVVSFAGTTDRRADLSWGGVTANGGRVELSNDDQATGVYGYGALHKLVGTNVKSNTRIEVGGGTYRYLDNQPDEKLTVGLSTTLLNYANNQNFYTYGHGGYFSPQLYLSFGVPVTWAKRSDNFTFQLKGSLGAQYFRQDATDYFPTNSDAQALSGKRYEQQRKMSLGYTLEGAGEYRFGPKWFVGGALRLNNSSDFRELNAAMYVRYTIEDMLGSSMKMPVSPYRSPYSN